MLSSVIIIVTNYRKAPYDSITDTLLFFVQGYSHVSLEDNFDSAVSCSVLMAVLLYALILLTRTANFVVAHRHPAFFFYQIKYIFRDITLLI